MPRKPRNEVEPGIHHVYARGNNRQPIFFDDHDRRTYLKLLAQAASRQGWRCLSYCLMPNHVHLLVETTAPNLGSGMQWLHGSYASRVNRRHGRCGHLFQGRYGCVRIRTDAHLWSAVAYIARNPVVAGLCRAAREWRWSSHETVTRAERDGWLDVGRLLSFLAAAGGDPLRRYRELVGGAGAPTVESGRSEHLADPTRDLRGLGVGGVLRPRPEEPAEPVLAVAGHDVDVQVRHRLADDVVDAVEDAHRTGGLPDRDAERPRSKRERAAQLVRKVPQRLVMLLRHEEDVPGEQRPRVEEREKRVVVEHDVRRE